MLTKEDMKKIADINNILQVEGDDCELEIESINWLIETVISFDVTIKELQDDHQRLSNAVNVLLEKVKIKREHPLGN